LILLANKVTSLAIRFSPSGSKPSQTRQKNLI
jgi:hypothetical protein